MKKQNNHIDDLFYNELESLSELPPAGIWGGVENALKERELIKKQRRRHRLIIAIAASVIVIAAASVIYWIAQDSSGVVTKQGQVAAAEVGSFDNRPQILAQSKTGKMLSPSAAGGQEPGVDGAHKADRVKDAMPNIERPTPDKKEGPGFSGENIVMKTPLQSEQPVRGFQTEQLAAIERSLPVTAAAPSMLPVAQAVMVLPEAGSDAAKTTVNTKSLRKHRFSIIGFFAPDITTRNLEQDVANAPDEKKDVIAQFEQNGMLDYTMGARVEYRLNKHFSIQSGLTLARNTIDIAPKTVYARFDKTGTLHYRFNMSTGYAFFKLKKIPSPRSLGDSANTSGSTSTLHYINIPLAIKYSFDVSRRLSFSMQVGITTRFIAWNKIATTYDYNGEKEKSINDDIQGLKKSYFNGVVGIGAEYAIGKHLSVTMFPTFNFATSSINKDAPVKAYPNTLSLSTGLKINL